MFLGKYTRALFVAFGVAGSSFGTADMSVISKVHAREVPGATPALAVRMNNILKQYLPDILNYGRIEAVPSSRSTMSTMFVPNHLTREHVQGDMAKLIESLAPDEIACWEYSYAKTAEILKKEGILMNNNGFMTGISEKNKPAEEAIRIVAGTLLSGGFDLADAAKPASQPATCSLKPHH